MNEALHAFERVARIASELSVFSIDREERAHPFDERNIHPEITKISIRLFDDGHYSQATFEAFKYLDIQVKKASNINDSGYRLMMAAFSENSPKIKLNTMLSSSDIDEQMGYKHIFAGAMSAIRNPRGHDINIDPIGRCLDHLSFASVLLRRLDERIV